MGINKFQSWLRNNFNNSIKKYDYRNFDHVYIDLNYILHKMISYASDENDLIIHVIKNIKDIIDHNYPSKTLNLAADGSANYAKILLQKKRRLSSTNSSNDSKNKLNPLILTAGTSFMNKFGNDIKMFAETSNFEFKINIDLSDNPDESEFKICRQLKRNVDSLFDTHLIVSNDADTILISISQINIFNINVLINISGEQYIVSIDDVVEQYFNIFGYNLNKRYDFVLISLLLGNDYFPKIKYANFDKLLSSYKESIKSNESIIINKKIIPHLLEKFISCFVKKIPVHYQSVSVNEYCNENISTYLEGIQWCVSLYESGNYPTYDYIYNGISIHPMSIVLHIIIGRMQNIKIRKSDCEKIQSDMCAAIVIPLSNRDLVPKKYHDILDNKLKYIYDEELCKKCKKYKNIIHKYDSSDVHDKNTFSHNGETIGVIKHNYIKHRKHHDIDNPREYITNIVQELKKI